MSTHTCRLLLLVAASGCAIPAEMTSSSALPVTSAQRDRPETDNAEGHKEHEGHTKGTQAVNLFAGGSGEVGDLDGFTFGADYGYHLSRRWGVGVFAETVSGLDRSLATGGVVYWHALPELVLMAGPGVERHHEEWRPIGRVGAFYEFPLNGNWVVSPAIFYDITEGENLWIYGLNLGYVF